MTDSDLPVCREATWLEACRRRLQPGIAGPLTPLACRDLAWQHLRLLEWDPEVEDRPGEMLDRAGVAISLFPAFVEVTWHRGRRTLKVRFAAGQVNFLGQIRRLPPIAAERWLGAARIAVGPLGNDVKGGLCDHLRWVEGRSGQREEECGEGGPERGDRP